MYGDTVRDSAVSGNLRLTFDIEQGDITNLSLEDYH